jgi:hypothetical protein
VLGVLVLALGFGLLLGVAVEEPAALRSMVEPVVFAPLPLGAVCVLVLGPGVSFAPAGLVALPVSLMAPELVLGLVLVCA